MSEAEPITVHEAGAWGWPVLVEAFRLAERCHGAWELEPDGIVNGSSTSRAPEQVVNVRREPLGLELVHDRSGVTVPRLHSPLHVHELLEAHLTIRADDRAHPRIIPWPELQVAAGEVQFVEEADPPVDAEVLSPGRPRRYRRRRSCPSVVRYGSLTLRGPDGFRAVWHFSRVEAAVVLSEGMIAVGAMRR